MPPWNRYMQYSSETHYRQSDEWLVLISLSLLIPRQTQRIESPVPSLVWTEGMLLRLRCLGDGNRVRPSLLRV